VWDAAANVKIYHSLAGEEAIRHATVTSFHVMTGASTLALALLIALAARTMAPSEEPALRGTEVAA
jgi:hypothetical protein